MPVYLRFVRYVVRSLTFLLLASCGGGGGGGGGDGGGGGVPTPPTNTTCVVPPRPTGTVSLELAFPNLSFNKPVLLLQAPGDDTRWFLVEQNGYVRVFPNQTSTTSVSLFADMHLRVAVDNEAGLLGMAFHPDFPSTPYVYLSYTRAGSPLISVISRFTVNAGGATLNMGTEQEILTLNQPYSNHNGGNIAFGSDGYLYIGFGDGGDAGDPDGNGQNTNVLLGKMLRINVNSGSPYSIPSDNPFASSSGGRAEIYAWGFRNPWRWSFDRTTHELWVGDVGQGDWEEVDRVQRGKNYGWDTREGAHCYNAGSCSTAGLTDPITEYNHGGSHCSVSGGYVYRGSAISGMQGTYVFGDFCSGQVWSVDSQATTGTAPTPLLSSGVSISSFGEANDGELYVLGYSESNTGRIYKFVSSAIDPGSFPQTLSDTGCVNPANHTQPAAGMAAYDINVPFWSDGASKERFFTAPTYGAVHIGSNDDWTFPVGAVLMKNFRVNGNLIETRLFMRHSDGEWGGYSYEWNDAQTDATLVLNGKDKTINNGSGTQSWHFPSTTECLRCHTSVAGRTLGPETSQMNLGGQLASLATAGWFDADVPNNPPAMPAPGDGSATLDQHARAYLHTNCSICHRPNGPTPVSMDLRYTTTLASTDTCNVTPQEGDLGVSGAKLIVPGDPSKSVISLRMHALNGNRMPPLGSSVVDSTGAALIDSWISSLSSCP